MGQKKRDVSRSKTPVGWVGTFLRLERVHHQQNSRPDRGGYFVQKLKMDYSQTLVYFSSTLSWRECVLAPLKK